MSERIRIGTVVEAIQIIIFVHFSVSLTEDSDVPSGHSGSAREFRHLKRVRRSPAFVSHSKRAFGGFKVGAV